MDILAAVLSLTLVYLCIFNGVSISKLISKDQSQDDTIENDHSPLEQKVEALSQVVEHLLVESKAKDLKILNLENRVSELETQPAVNQIVEPNGMQVTHTKPQRTIEFLAEKKDNTSNNFNGRQTVHEYSDSTNQASEYKHSINKSKLPRTL